MTKRICNLGIFVIPMETPRRASWGGKGDVFRWEVSGPGDESQKFFTKKQAKQYADIRKNSATSGDAIREYARLGQES